MRVTLLQHVLNLEAGLPWTPEWRDQRMGRVLLDATKHRAKPLLKNPKTKKKRKKKKSKAKGVSAYAGSAVDEYIALHYDRYEWHVVMKQIPAVKSTIDTLQEDDASLPVIIDTPEMAALQHCVREFQAECAQFSLLGGQILRMLMQRQGVAPNPRQSKSKKKKEEEPPVGSGDTIPTSLARVSDVLLFERNAAAKSVPAILAAGARKE
jgi:hypothetical protein